MGDKEKLIDKGGQVFWPKNFDHRFNDTQNRGVIT